MQLRTQRSQDRSLALGLAASLAATLAGALCLLPLAIVAPGGDAGGPPELRWIHQSPASEAWVPDSVALVADGFQVLVGSRGAIDSLRVLDGPAQGFIRARQIDEGINGVAGTLEVIAGPDPDSLFTLVQYPVASDPTLLHTEVTRHEGLAAEEGGAFVPRWLHSLDIHSKGPARLLSDEAGTVLVALVWDAENGELRADWLRPADGLLLRRDVTPSLGLDAASLSSDGSTLVVAAANALSAWAAPAGSEDPAVPFFTFEMLMPAHSVALSEDGSSLVVAGRGQAVVMLRTVQQDEVTYVPGVNLARPRQYLASAVAVDDAATVLAVGWWDQEHNLSTDLELWDLTVPAIIWSESRGAVAGGLQDLPIEALVTDDGSRALFASWGDGIGGRPEVVLVDRDEARAVLRLNLPGSPRDVAMDEAGTRIAVAHSDLHANHTNYTGAVRMYDTGERELVLDEVPLTGGSLAAHADTDPFGTVFFFVGELGAPTPFGGGTLLLDRDTMYTYPRLADASGRAELSIPIPEGPALVGRRLDLQVGYEDFLGFTSMGETTTPSWVLSN